MRKAAPSNSWAQTLLPLPHCLPRAGGGLTHATPHGLGKPRVDSDRLLFHPGPLCFLGTYLGSESLRGVVA